jgi:N6-L-threonylcarbamoyladenine synthase
MLVLGLESSCDETAAAVVDGGRRALSDVVASQVEVHARYGGVVPELASRAHVVNMVPVIEEALARASVTLDDIGGVAVTQGPGLIGALLVAVQMGKGIAYARGLPLVGVHHLEGHLSAVHLEPEPPPLPHLALVVSGGHTSLIRVDHGGLLTEIGATRDDAAGEAFDKVAKLLGLGYPGGVVIDRLARIGDPTAVAFPRAMTKKQTGYEFSFSGLKTAMLVHLRAHGVPAGQELADLCASFQATVVELLVRKTRLAVRSSGLAHVQVCGGVAANSRLRSEMSAAGREDGFRVYIPPPARCTDNAAMIAAAGAVRLARGERASWDMTADSALPLPGARAASPP